MSYLSLCKLDKTLFDCWNWAIQTRAGFLKKHKGGTILNLNIVTLCDALIKMIEDKVINLYVSITLFNGIVKLYEYKVDIIVDIYIKLSQERKMVMKKANKKIISSIPIVQPKDIDLKAVFEKKDNIVNSEKITIVEEELIPHLPEVNNFFGDEQFFCANKALAAFVGNHIQSRRSSEDTSLAGNTLNTQNDIENNFTHEDFTVSKIRDDTEVQASMRNRKRKISSVGNNITPTKHGRSNAIEDDVPVVMLNGTVENMSVDNLEKDQTNISDIIEDKVVRLSSQKSLSNYEEKTVTIAKRKNSKPKRLKITRRQRPFKQHKSAGLEYFVPTKRPYNASHLFTPLIFHRGTDVGVDVDINLENAMHFDDYDKYIDFELDCNADDFFEQEMKSIVNKFDSQTLIVNGDGVQEGINGEQATIQQYLDSDSPVLSVLRSIEDQSLIPAIENINLTNQETVGKTILDSADQQTIFDIDITDYTRARLTTSNLYESEQASYLQWNKTDSPGLVANGSDTFPDELNNFSLQNEVAIFQELFPSEETTKSQRFMQFKRLLFLDNKRKIIANQKEPYGPIEIRKV